MVEAVVAAHNAVEVVVGHDAVEVEVVAHDALEAVVIAHGAVEVEVVAHDAVELVASFFRFPINLDATFYLTFQQKTFVSHKKWVNFNWIQIQKIYQYLNINLGN